MHFLSEKHVTLSAFEVIFHARNTHTMPKGSGISLRKNAAKANVPDLKHKTSVWTVL